MDIKMPQLGESVTEGTIGRWLVQPGTQVKKYQAIVEVITDKVNAEVPAPADGTVTALKVAEGANVKVGTVIATMDVTGAAAANGAAAGAGGKAEPRRGTAAVRGGAATVAATPSGRFSPAVLKLAQEYGINLNLVSGTGMGGRITRRDVEDFLAAPRDAVSPTAAPGPAAAPAAAAPTATGVPAPSPAPAGPTLSVQPPQEVARVEAASAPPVVVRGDEVIPITPVRRHIAERMVMSKRDVPHAWTMMRADVTKLVRFRESAKQEFRQREGVNLTFMPFFIKAVTDSLREFPMLNAQWTEEGIVVKREINISVAVATDDALMVPVIKNADRLSIAGLAHALSNLVTRARQGKLTVDDVQGGTFTVNNTGAFESFLSAPIINFPQAAIMTVEAIVREPVVLEGDAIAIRHMVNLCLSLDHRVLDGLVCGRFLQSVRRRVESYAPDTVNLY